MIAAPPVPALIQEHVRKGSGLVGSETGYNLWLYDVSVNIEAGDQAVTCSVALASCASARP